MIHLHHITASADYVALMRARSMDDVIGALRSCERERRVVLLKAVLFGEGDDKRPAEPARKPRKPTLASVAKQASKAAIAVARYEVKPDGTVVVVTGKPEPAAPPEEWPLDEFRTKETKQ
jgi:hypothetical protein